MDMRTRDISTQPDFFWPDVGKPGLVPLWALVASPDQPRKHFDPKELSELAGTMRTGGQREILTVRKLSEEELQKYAPARYMVKSGERRMRAAPEAGLTELEIRVKQYANEAEERLDTWMLNEQRVGLSDIENAREIQTLAEMHGWKTQTEIAAHTGKTQMWVSDHLRILTVSPKVLARMEPNVKKRDRFVRNVGVFFSKLSLDVQEDFVTRMPPHLKSGPQQIGWMSAELKRLGIALETRERSPKDIQRRVNTLSDIVRVQSEGLLSAADFSKLFLLVSPQKRDELLQKLSTGMDSLKKLQMRVEELAVTTQSLAVPATQHRPLLPPETPVKQVAKRNPEDGSETARQQDAERAIAAHARAETKPVAPQRVIARTVQESAQPAPTMKRIEVPESKTLFEEDRVTYRGKRLAPVPPPRSLNDRSVVQQPPANHEPKEPENSEGRERRQIREWARKGIEVGLSDGLRCPLKNLRPHEYVAAFDRGDLEFQVKHKEKPEHLPTRAQAIKASKL